MEIRKGDGRHCDLCGSSSPQVRCDKCNNQIFCLSCDDMYHRHPKRRTHVRKVCSDLGLILMRVDSFTAFDSILIVFLLLILS